jgi:hypothetical protein
MSSESASADVMVGRWFDFIPPALLAFLVERC